MTSRLATATRALLRALPCCQTCLKAIATRGLLGHEPDRCAACADALVAARKLRPVEAGPCDWADEVEECLAALAEEEQGQ